MPALAANQVSLAEVLEVKGGPLNEEEIWAILSQASTELESVLAKGKGKNYGQPSLFISPESLILSYSGHVKVSATSGRAKYKNPAYRAPELNLSIVPPSDGAVEKMYVYSLGMTVYYAAEYALKKSKMAHLSVSLGKLLLSMCEELAKTRFTLRQVLRACGTKYSQSSYSEVIKSLVVLVLGNNIPEVTSLDNHDTSQPRQPLRRSYSSDNQHPSRTIRSRYSRSSLELPSPPMVQTVTHGQITVAEPVGSNDRSLSTPDDHPSYHSPDKFMTKIPHTLDKYRKYLEKARSKKSDSATSPVVVDRSIDLSSSPYGHYGTVPFMNGRHPHGAGSSVLRSPRHRYRRAHSYHGGMPDKGYEEGPFSNGVQSRAPRSGKLAVKNPLGNHYQAASSDASSEASSLSDHPMKSTLSSAPSSSLVSLMEGSYKPDTSLTDHGSDYWGSTTSVRGTSSALEQSGDWQRSSVSDLRSVSQQSHHIDDDTKYSNGFGHMNRWSPEENDGGRKYLSEQNLASPEKSESNRIQRKSPKAKLRKFFGPEFVQVSEDPNKSVVDITPKKGQKRVSGRRLVIVEMLNKQRLEMTVESSANVMELFTQVTKYVGIVEKIYFGLARFENNEYLFLDFDKKLSKYAPSGWKEQSKKSITKFTLYFRVKFYVENLSLHRYHETTHQFYLQLRNDLIHGHLMCDEDSSLNLASLALQAEYGNYTKKKFGENYFTLRYYVPHRIVGDNEDEICQKLRGLHKIRCNLDQDLAEVKFIKECQKVPEYGMHIYEAKKKENEMVYLGICVRGITVYGRCQDVDGGSGGKKVLEKHSWQMIKKLAFKKKKFMIIPRTEENVEKEKKITFYSASYKRSKYFLYMCTSFHRFQMRMKVRLLTTDEPRQGIATKPAASSHNANEEKQFTTDDALRDNGFDSSDDDGSLPSRKSSVVDDKTSVADGTMAESEEAPEHEIGGHPTLPYVIDITPLKSHTDGTPSSKQGNLAHDVTLSPDRKVRAIRLRKDSHGAIGLTVVGGEDTQRLHFGIFVKRISSGSVAAQDGRLQVGDRILAVNGKSLEYVSHDEAVQALKNTSVDVELLVSQSIRTESHIDASAMNTPTPANVDTTRARSASRDDHASPYLVGNDDDSPTRRHSSDYANWPQRVPTPPPYKKPQRPNTSSTNTGDTIQSGPTSPEPRSRVRHYGGIKLPGMEDGVVQGVSLSNSHSPAVQLHASRVSESGLGSNPAEVLPEESWRDDVLDKTRHKGSLGDASLSNVSLGNVSLGNMSLGNMSLGNGSLDNVSLGNISLGDTPDTAGRTVRSRSSSGIQTRVEEEGVGTDSSIGVKTGTELGRSASSRPRTPISSAGVAGLDILEQKNSDGNVGHLPVGVVEQRSQGTSPGDDNLVQPNHFTVELIKESGSLGLNVTGGTNTSVKDGAIYVKSMYPNGPADLNGQIQVGHKILSVNGISLQGVTHKQAVETIKRAPVDIVLVIEGPPLVETSPGYDVTEVTSLNEKEASVFEVVLMKGIGGLGMSLVGGIDYSEQYGVDLRIKAMFPGQPAENSEQLRVGDVILAANGVSLQGYTNREAIDVLRDQPTRVVLLVRRDPSTIPASLLRRGSFSQNIDPNEVLSAIHSKILKEDSRRSEASVYSTNSDDNPLGGPVLQGLVLQDDGVSMSPGTEDDIELDVISGEVFRSDSASSIDLGLPPPPDDNNLIMSSQGGDDESADQDERGGDVGGGDGAIYQPRERESYGVRGSVASTGNRGGGQLAPEEEIIDLVLHKGSSGLGFTLAGGADTVGGCFVREIIGDPARSEGTLRPKDQIIMVNGQDTTNKRHMEAVNILRSTRNEVHLVVRRRPDKVKSQTRDGLNIKTVSIIRTTRGRIGLVLGRDKQGQICAEDVVPDEPAAKDGGLKRGDVILEVNGERVDGSDLAHAQTCLEDAKPVVTLVLKQFRTDTESKYMLNSPTESDQGGNPDALVISPTTTESPDLPPTTFLPQDMPSPGITTPVFHAPGQDVAPRFHDLGAKMPENEPQRKDPLGDYNQEESTSSKFAKKSEVYNREESTPGKYSVLKNSQDNKFTPPEISPYGKQPYDIRPHDMQHSADSPLANGDVRKSFSDRYSRHSLPEELGPVAGMQVDSRESEDKEEHDVINGEIEDEVEVRGETGGEDDLSDGEDNDDAILKKEIFVSILEKGPRGLGFSLFTGRTLSNIPGLFIRSIQPNSVVEEDGKISVGDQLLKVNEESVETLSHNEVITMLRQLSGAVRLEMLRVHDGDDDEEEDEDIDDEPNSSSLHYPGYPNLALQSPDVPAGNNETPQQDNTLPSSSATTPDFSEDLDIVLNAIEQNKHTELPYSDTQDLSSSTEMNLADRSYVSNSAESGDEISAGNETPDKDTILERWPAPPASLPLAPTFGASEISDSNEDIADYNGNVATNSEEDTTSVTFSEDGFLEELEDSAYTPSTDTEVKRPGVGSPVFQALLGDRRSSDAPFLPASSPVDTTGALSRGIRPGKEVDEGRLGTTSRDLTPRTNSLPSDPIISPRIFNDPSMSPLIPSDPRMSPLIPESFLNASRALSPSLRTISPDVPPPLPTTPLPSDDDLGNSLGSNSSSRARWLQGMTMRERLEKVANETSVPKGRFEFPLRPKSPLALRTLPTVEPRGPLLRVDEHSKLYSGENLKNARRKLEHMISSGKAAEEYAELRELKPVDNCPSGKRALNKEKNRYRDVLPYEKTRVVLSGDEQVDYINANYVDVAVGSDTYSYIATQGPLPGTTRDFWKMVWEQQCQVIAMVTMDMETGKVKCHRYWPESPELPVKVSYLLEVHLEAVETHDTYVQRLIRVKNLETDESLEVVHLNFLCWPDHGVPKSAIQLVDYINNVRTHSSLGPSIVHCSAGIGRTGTFLTIDSCMKHIEKGLKFDIIDIVRDLRNQRPRMIQTKDQYLFCYQSCLEMLKSLEF